jgi:hypothetical protein
MNKQNKEDIMKKWSAILGPMGITGSQLDNLSQLAENQSNQILEENTLASSITTQQFPSLLPLARKISSQLFGGMSKEERERIEAEVKSENRDGKIDSLIEGTKYVEKKVEEHPDYKSGTDLVPVQPLSSPVGQLFYLDFKYGSTHKKTRRSGKKHKKNNG